MIYVNDVVRQPITETYLANETLRFITYIEDCNVGRKSRYLIMPIDMRTRLFRDVSNAMIRFCSSAMTHVAARNDCVGNVADIHVCTGRATTRQAEITLSLAKFHRWFVSRGRGGEKSWP